jgi:hypothetical protein
MALLAAGGGGAVVLMLMLVCRQAKFAQLAICTRSASARRSGSARAASSGPTTLPSPRQPIISISSPSSFFH